MKLAFICRLALAVIFSAAGIMKLRDIKGFAYDLHLFGLTPWTLSKSLAFFLPGFEIVAGVALFIPALRLGGVFAVMAMSAAFSFAISSAWARGLDISCGCFGHSQSPSNYPLHLTATLVMLAASCWLISREVREGTVKFQ